MNFFLPLPLPSLSLSSRQGIREAFLRHREELGRVSCHAGWEKGSKPLCFFQTQWTSLYFLCSHTRKCGASSQRACYFITWTLCVCDLECAMLFCLGIYYFWWGNQPGLMFVNGFFFLGLQVWSGAPRYLDSRPHASLDPLPPFVFSFSLFHQLGL